MRTSRAPRIRRRMKVPRTWHEPPGEGYGRTNHLFHRGSGGGNNAEKIASKPPRA